MKHTNKTADLITDLKVIVIAFGTIVAFTIFGFMIAFAMPQI